jgi:hypothetical protein
MALDYLGAEGAHVEVDEVYILGVNGERTDRIIEAIAWWTQEQ